MFARSARSRRRTWWRAATATVCLAAALPAVTASAAVVLPVVAASAAPAPSAPSSRPAAATWASPTFLRSIGAHGRPSVYAWGVAYNPVTDEVLVGDYLNATIRRFSPDGRLLGSFWVPASQRMGHPESVAVDPRDGSVYASTSTNGQDAGAIAKFDSRGTFLFYVATVAKYHAWITVDDAGALYIADSHFGTDKPDNPPKVRKYTVDDAAKAGTEVASFGEWGTGQGQWRWITGLDVDSSMRLYAADPILRTVHVFDVRDAAHPVWLRDIGKSGKKGDYTGDLRGVAVDDAAKVVFVADAQAGEIEKFTLEGKHLVTFGSLGAGEGQFGDGGRQLSVGSGGTLWAPDYGNFRVHHFAGDGSLLGTYPDPPQPAPLGGIAQPRDVAVNRRTGEVWVAETDNHRFQGFAADGTPIGAWGARGSFAPLGFNYPRGIGVEPVSGDVWVVDSSGDQIRVFSRTATGVTYSRTLGHQPRGWDPGHFLKPMDVAFSGGKAYVSAYSGPQVKILDATTGAEVGTIAKNNNGVAVDEATGDVYLVSWSLHKVFRYSSTGKALGSWGEAGSRPGQLDTPWDVDVVAGVVYVSDAKLGRVSAFTPAGDFLGAVGTKGSGPGQFLQPSGLDHDDAGNLYVADTGNDRVQVLATDGSPAPAAGAAPRATVTTPAAKGTLAVGAPLQGSATDDARVGVVQVALQDLKDTTWWDAATATWVAAKTWNLVAITATSPTEVGWTMPVSSLAPGRRYAAQARAVDSTGQVQTVAARTVRFTVTAS